jgi:hypothetical protein
MREAARALDDVSDHLGLVLRRADDLLAEWSRFGAQVRTQVDREVIAIGEVVDGAVTRAASAGLDRAIADRLRALTTEIERLEQRTRAASRAVAERRDGDRRVLWIVVAGIVVANALLVALLLRKPDAALVADPIRIESTVAPQPAPTQGTMPAGGSGEPTSAAGAGSAADTPDAKSPGPNAGSGAPSSGANAAGAKAGADITPSAPAKPTAPAGNAAKQPAETAGPAKSTPSPIALPPKSGNPRPHKKLP